MTNNEYNFRRLTRLKYCVYLGLFIIIKLILGKLFPQKIIDYEQFFNFRLVNTKLLGLIFPQLISDYLIIIFLPIIKKRLQDLGMNWIWLIFVFIPLYGNLLHLTLIVFKGDNYTNKFGKLNIKNVFSIQDFKI
jgi:uncharacterized membrane protein YhaH (DUF805 family)